MAEKPSDFNLPEKTVTKLMRDSLPDNVSVSKDAKSAAARGASIFILQLVIAANEHAQKDLRDTFNCQDIIMAISDVGLGEYAPILVRFNAQLKRDAKRKESSMLKSKAERQEVINNNSKMAANESNDYQEDRYLDSNLEQT